MSDIDDMIQKAADSVDQADGAVEVLALALDPENNPADELPSLTDEQRSTLDYIAEVAGGIADKTNAWLTG